jgi:hypothetical protein
VSAPPAGLCDSCHYQRLVHNTRGSVFSLCERSRADPDYPRYPRLPVLECAGHEPRQAARSEGSGKAGGPRPPEDGQRTPRGSGKGQ